LLSIQDFININNSTKRKVALNILLKTTFL